MGRKETRRGGEASKPASPRTPLISRRGWITIGLGSAVTALGYVVLSFTDPQGQNLASRVSPFLILGGYTTIGAGIVLRDRSTPPSPLK
jgi:hypothetical protein